MPHARVRGCEGTRVRERKNLLRHPRGREARNTSNGIYTFWGCALSLFCTMPEVCRRATWPGGQDTRVGVDSMGGLRAY